jgi:hypothetical protein
MQAVETISNVRRTRADHRGTYPGATHGRISLGASKAPLSTGTVALFFG